MTALNYLVQFQKSDLILSHEGLGNTSVIGFVRTVVSASLVLAGCRFQALMESGRKSRQMLQEA